jgi:hypothetical protein
MIVVLLSVQMHCDTKKSQTKKHKQNKTKKTKKRKKTQQKPEKIKIKNKK